MGREHILWHCQYYWNEGDRTHEHVICLVDAWRHSRFSHHPARESTHDGKFLSYRKSLSSTCNLITSDRTLPTLCLRMFKSRFFLVLWMKESLTGWLVSPAGNLEALSCFLGFFRWGSAPSCCTMSHTAWPYSRLYTRSRGARQQLK